MTAAETDAARLERILRGLRPSDALFLSQLVERPRDARARLLATRNAAIRAVRPYCAGGSPAKAIEAALERCLEEWWSPEGGLRPLGPAATMREQLLHRVLELNGGDTLGWRRIHDVLNGVE